VGSGARLYEVNSPFPNLLASNHRITSRADPQYNCFAWAAHYTDRWLQPHGFGYWPGAIPDSLTLNNLTAVYAKDGFERCASSEPELGYEKIAIYADRRGLPRHAARQLADGKWSSKLGEFEDIEHDTLEALESPEYGRPVRYLRRALAPVDPDNQGLKSPYIP
jgi:hypothetical protein